MCAYGRACVSILHRHGGSKQGVAMVTTSFEDRDRGNWREVDNVVYRNRRALKQPQRFRVWNASVLVREWTFYPQLQPLSKVSWPRVHGSAVSPSYTCYGPRLRERKKKRAFNGLFTQFCLEYYAALKTGNQSSVAMSVNVTGPRKGRLLVAKHRHTGTAMSLFVVFILFYLCVGMFCLHLCQYTACTSGA